MWRADRAYQTFCRLRPRLSSLGRNAVRALGTRIPKRVVAVGASTVAVGVLSTQTAHLATRKPRKRRHTRKNGNELCKAVKAGDLQRVRELALNGDFDPDARHEMGFAGIHIAVVEQNYEMAKLLLELGCDVNLQDLCGPHEGLRRTEQFSAHIRHDSPTQGFSPLHYAVALQNEDMIILLIQHGADPQKTDALKRTPLDWIDKRTPRGQKITDLIEEQYDLYLENKDARDREYRKQYPLEDQLKKRIVGQLSPIHSVASAIRRKQNGWHDEDHPLVFLFLGSSGVGKTELAKTVAKCLFKDDPQSFIRIDMSEFQHKHEVAKFIGSPPGYVGHEEGGQLTKRLKERPNAIVLLDEVEKAHPDVLTIMLQLFDEGRITDGKGETMECKDAIFVMTSNLAQTEIGNEAEELRREAREKAGLTGLNDEATSLSREFIEETVQPILKSHFQRDEFLGRINEILYFLPFNDAELKELTLRELRKWESRAMDRHGIKVTWSDAALEELQTGYNFRYGARSIQHEVEKRVVNQIAKAHELGKVQEKGGLHVDCVDGNIQLSFSEPQATQSKGWFS